MTTLPCATLVSAAAMKARTVSETKVKSRMGASEPRVISLLRASAWQAMVGITARADWRGPYVLNGLTVVTASPKLR